MFQTFLTSQPRRLIESARHGFYHGYATHLGLHLSTHAEKETRYIQYASLVSIVLYLIHILKAHVCYFALMVGLLHYLYSLHPDFYTLENIINIEI
jgi:hypothetical protein